MYAIIKTGGKQYRVAEGDFLKVETLNADVEGEVVFNEVLAVSTEEGLKVGTPVVEGAAVTAVVTHHGRADKVRIFKFRRRKHSMKSAGPRQNYTAVICRGTVRSTRKSRSSRSRLNLSNDFLKRT